MRVFAQGGSSSDDDVNEREEMHRTMATGSLFSTRKIVKMKLAIATLLAGSAAAFAPGATAPARSSALNMAATTTEKVRSKEGRVPRRREKQEECCEWESELRYAPI